MISGFVTLAGVLLGFLFKQILRHQAKEDDPKQQNLERYEKIDADLVKGDSLVLTGHATDDLELLERLRNARKGH